MAHIRWRNTNAAPAGAVTPVELFFDIVVVFTLTQLTRALEGDLSLAGAGRILLLFGVLWWMYGGYAWLTNHVPPRRTSQKLLLFTGMAGFLVAAVGIPHAFDRTVPIATSTSAGAQLAVVVAVVATMLLVDARRRSVAKTEARKGYDLRTAKS